MKKEWKRGFVVGPRVCVVRLDGDGDGDGGVCE